MQKFINQQQIIQNVQNAIGVVIFVSVVELILIVFSFSSRQVYESISVDYHQESIELLSQIGEEMAIIRFELLKYSQSNIQDKELLGQRELVRSIYIVGRHNKQLQKIENLPNHQDFKEQTKALNKYLTQLANVININSNETDIHTIVNEQNIIFIKLKVEQLKLLHHQLNDLLLEKIDRTDKRNILMIILVAMVMLIISIYIIRRSVNIIKTGLDVQQAYQEQLAEEKASLFKQEAENREILSSVIEGIVTVDETGRILTFNHAAEAMFGLSKNNVIGSDIKLLMPKSDADKHDGYVQHFLKTGDKKIIGKPREVNGWHHQRGEFPIRLSISKLPSQGGELKRFIASIQDLTQIKSQEEQIRRTQKMDALGKLTGGIAHDYNNMLAVISGYANLLAEQLTDEAYKKYAIEIAKAGDRGAQLTRRLLSFSKRTNTTNELCNLSDILNQMSDMLEKTLTARIQVIFKLDKTLPQVKLNSGDLEDAILNICINSMHAIEGNGNIEIQTSQVNLGYAEFVELRIVDDGCGMDEETRHQIFDPFFSTKGEQGTGLGLSQVYSFVERSQGSIDVESKLGIGSQVVIRFPVAHESQSENRFDNRLADKNINLQGSVLVVDDERQILDFLSIILKQTGLEIRTASNGEMALKMLAEQSADILLSDIIMPKMNGIDLAHEVQRKYPDIKIQLATGYASDIEISELDDTIAKSILAKPYDANTIIQRISDLLQEKQI